MIDNTLALTEPVTFTGKDADLASELLNMLRLESGSSLTMDATMVRRAFDEQEAVHGTHCTRLLKNAACFRKLLRKNGHLALANSYSISNAGIGLIGREIAAAITDHQLNEFRNLTWEYPSMQVAIDLEMEMGLEPEYIFNATRRDFSDLWERSCRQSFQVRNGVARSPNSWVSEDARFAFARALELTKRDGGKLPGASGSRAGRSSDRSRQNIANYYALCKELGIGPDSARRESITNLASLYAECMPFHSEHELLVQISLDLGLGGALTQWIKAKFLDQATLDSMRAESLASTIQFFPSFPVGVSAEA
jgi:hypothetical protein